MGSLGAAQSFQSTSSGCRSPRCPNFGCTRKLGSLSNSRVPGSESRPVQSILPGRGASRADGWLHLCPPITNVRFRTHKRATPAKQATEADDFCLPVPRCRPTPSNAFRCRGLGVLVTRHTSSVTAGDPGGISQALELTEEVGRVWALGLDHGLLHPLLSADQPPAL